MSKFYYQLVHKIIALEGILKFTLKQLHHVSVLSPSSGSVHFELAKVTFKKKSQCILIISSKMQQCAGIYLLQNYSTCFGCPSHSSSGVHKTVTAASGAGHSIWATTFLQRGLRPCWRKVVAMTCTGGCSYNFMYS